jgi:hypothetical protein
MISRFGLAVVSALVVAACYAGADDEESASADGTQGSGNSGPALQCEAANEMWCAGSCADIMTNADHCGGCDNDCGPTSQCEGGVCTGICAGGQTLCAGNCVTTDNDASNCGQCFNGCGDGISCVGGFCDNCTDGTVLCGGDCADFNNDSNHCGECFNDCGDGMVCEGATCVVFVDTDGPPMTTGPGDSSGGGTTSGDGGTTGGTTGGM